MTGGFTYIVKPIFSPIQRLEPGSQRKAVGSKPLETSKIVEGPTPTKAESLPKVGASKPATPAATDAPKHTEPPSKAAEAPEPGDCLAGVIPRSLLKTVAGGLKSAKK